MVFTMAFGIASAFFDERFNKKKNEAQTGFTVFIFMIVGFVVDIIIFSHY